KVTDRAAEELVSRADDLLDRPIRVTHEQALASRAQVGEKGHCAVQVDVGVVPGGAEADKGVLLSPRIGDDFERLTISHHDKLVRACDGEKGHPSVVVNCGTAEAGEAGGGNDGRLPAIALDNNGLPAAPCDHE